MDRIRYVIGVLLVVSMPPAIVWWYIVHPFVGFWRSLGPRLALTVVSVAMVAAAGGLLLVRDTLLGADLGTSWPLAGLALVLVVGAVGIALRRKRYLTTRILAGMPELEGDDSTLLTEGPYAVIRHPRYVEVVLAVFGYAAFANHVGAWVTALVTLPALHLVVVLEERELGRRFGATWNAYQRRVPRYVPRFRRD